MDRSITIKPQEVPAPENGARGGFFAMDMGTPQRTAELDGEDACEDELNPIAQVVHTKKAPELHIRTETAEHDAMHCPYVRWCEYASPPVARKTFTRGPRA